MQVIFGAKFLEVTNLVWLSAIFGTLYSLVYLYAQYFVAQNSRFAFLGILAVVFQIIAIYIAHSSLYQILLINILINGVLLIVYIAQVIRLNFLLKINNPTMKKL